MSDQLFIKLYTDEDVSVVIAAMVRARGFDVLSTLDAGNLGALDNVQLQFAVKSERTFLTHNRVDFERLARQYFDLQLSHAGIIIAARRPPSETVSRLLKILNELSSDEIRDQIRYI